MLDEVETTELREMIADDPLTAILRMREVYSHRAKQHNAQRSAYNWVYQFLGCLSVVLAVVLGGLDGCVDSTAITVLALSVAALNALLSFTGMESRVQRHDTAARQYTDLESEIEKVLLTDRLSESPEKIRDLERVVFERFCIVSSSEPRISGCCKRMLKPPTPSPE